MKKIILTACLAVFVSGMTACDGSREETRGWLADENQINGETVPASPLPMQLLLDVIAANGIEPTASGATLTPAEINVTAGPGATFGEHKNLNLPAEIMPPKGDFMFSMDLTGSMGGSINNVKTNAVAIMNAIKGVVPDSQFGVASHKDYLGAFNWCDYPWTYGSDDDYPYRLECPLTADLMAPATALSGMGVWGGYDGPESYLRVFYESYADPNIAYRENAKRVVIAFLDNIPHDCGLDTGIDPGRDAVAGTADDLTIDNVLAGMIANKVTLIVVYSGDSAYFDYWKSAAVSTGGNAFQIGWDGTIPGGVDIATYIAGLVSSTIGHFHSVNLQVCDPADGAWVTSIAPDAYHELDLGTMLDLSFDILFRVPDGITGSGYSFEVCAMGDGSELARQLVNVQLEVPVGFDFHPTSCPSPLNMKSNGNSPAAITGAADFDVTRIDPASIRLEGVAPTKWEYEDVTEPYAPYQGKEGCDSCTTSGADGVMDLTLKFDTQELAAALGVVADGECRVVRMSGNLKAEFGGTRIVGEDVLKIIKKK